MKPAKNFLPCDECGELVEEKDLQRKHKGHEYCVECTIDMLCFDGESDTLVPYEELGK